MPAHNAEKYIEEAIESVIGQAYKDWELIVVNDGSTDNTENIVSRFVEEEPRVKLINEENRNPAATRNVGIRNATGDWIAFLDSDDIWLPEKLSVQHEYIIAKPEIDVFLTDGYTRFEDIDVKSYYNFYVAKNFVDSNAMYRIAFECNPMPILSVIIKKNWIQKVGFQDERKIAFGSEDWDYCLRLALGGANFFGIEERLFIYRNHSGGISSKWLKQRLSSAAILIKNFRAELLSKEAVNNFKRELIRLHQDLVKNTLTSEAEILRTSFSKLEQLDKKPLVKSLFFSSISHKVQTLADQFILALRNVFKSSFLWVVRTSLFSLYKLYTEYSSQINIQYHRWSLGKSLETRGSFYLHPTAKINCSNTPSKILTLGLSIGKYTQINSTSPGGVFTTGQDVKIGSYCTFNILGKLAIDTNVIFSNYCSVNCTKEIIIGDNTWFGEGVRLYDNIQQFNGNQRLSTEKGLVTGKICIGRNVWVGSNTVILQNVTIGDNCVIGENKVIDKSIPPDTKV